MSDDPPRRRTDGTRLSRRRYLLAAGGVGAGCSLAGCGSLAREESRTRDTGTETTSGRDGQAEGEDEPDAPGTEAVAERDDFLWFNKGHWVDERFREDLFAFARRHDLAVVLAHPGGSDGGDALRAPMAAAAEFDLDVWLRIGIPRPQTAETLVTDDGARTDHLDRLRRIVRRHEEVCDGDRMILWEEAPVMGEWIEGGAWNAAAADAMLEHGPALFAAQRRAVLDANPDLDVGIFVHFPYVVDSKRPEVFPTLIDRLRDRDALPDFAFSDFYRGWYEKDVGVEGADAAVRSLVANAKAALGGREMLYLGQSHTINPNHTPSRDALRSNLRASLEAGADGLGWYVRTEYVPTRRGFDPLVPNAEGATFDGAPVNTATVARDRLLFAWLSTLATRTGFDPADRVDLWLCGAGIGFNDHRLSVRTVDGDWAFLGHLGGYLGGDYPHADDRVAIRRGLAAERYRRAGGLELRIETDAASDGARLRAVHAMPGDPDAYVTEPDAAAIVAGAAEVESHSRGTARPGVALDPGSTRHVTVPLDDGSDDGADDAAAGLDALRHPEWTDELRRLATAEAAPEFDPGGRFDLWIGGTGLADPASLPSLRDRAGEEVQPIDAAVVSVGADAAAVCYGLDRDRFRPAEGLNLTGDGAAGAGVDVVLAMPYAGRAAFRPPERTAALLDDQPAEVATFGIASEER